MFLSIWRFIQNLFAAVPQQAADSTNHGDVLVRELTRTDKLGQHLCGACHALINMRTELEQRGKGLRGQDAVILFNFLKLIDAQLTRLYSILSSGCREISFSEQAEIRAMLNDYRLVYAASEVKPPNDDHLWYVREIQDLTNVPDQTHRP
jgi:hypothetical protein